MTKLITLTNIDDQLSFSFIANETAPGQFEMHPHVFTFYVQRIFSKGYRKESLRAYVPTWQRELSIGTKADGRIILAL